ncbi:hypothetical protein EXIGLDRAFT_763308 [Exidia glandulosa HHB12029]|uniref:Uncharacterized protein n=1 Tax=Exidia glandulosa HHB12029 TaxID=1314781 RepID=A0A165M1E5_EXIGL|nr:hypothetical protein EXIGLDRAFT_763308 [Exidia glandulosa HHB12029]
MTEGDWTYVFDVIRKEAGIIDCVHTTDRLCDSTCFAELLASLLAHRDRYGFPPALCLIIADLIARALHVGSGPTSRLDLRIRNLPNLLLFMASDLFVIPAYTQEASVQLALIVVDPDPAVISHQSSLNTFQRAICNLLAMSLKANVRPSSGVVNLVAKCITGLLCGIPQSGEILDLYNPHLDPERLDVQHLQSDVLPLANLLHFVFWGARGGRWGVPTGPSIWQMLNMLNNSAAGLLGLADVLSTMLCAFERQCPMDYRASGLIEHFFASLHTVNILQEFFSSKVEDLSGDRYGLVKATFTRFFQHCVETTSGGCR